MDSTDSHSYSALPNASGNNLSDQNSLQQYYKTKPVVKRAARLAEIQMTGRSVSAQGEVFRQPMIPRPWPPCDIPEKEEPSRPLPLGSIPRSAEENGRRSQAGDRLRTVFRRIRNTIQAIGGMKSRSNSNMSPFGSHIRRDSASIATQHITVTIPQPQIDPNVDPMQLWRFRFRKEWVVDAAGDHYFYWLGLLSIAIVYNTTMVVPRAVFQELNQGSFRTAFFFLDYFSDLLYIIDVVVGMFCGYLEDGVSVQEPRKLIRRYFRGRKSKLDVLSIFPTDLVLPFTGIHVPYMIVRINRVLKYHRFNQFYSLLESRTVYPDFFRMLYLVLSFVEMIHLNACLYYFISEMAGLNSDGWVYPGEASWRLPDQPNGVSVDIPLTNANDTLTQKYLWSFHWSMQTLTLIGQVKQPEQENEFIFVTLNFLVGILIFANIVGNVSRTIANMNMKMDNFRNRMDNVRNYCTLRKIEGDLQDRIVGYFEYQWMNARFVDEAEALRCLPDKLEAELAMRVHLDTLQRVRIFQGVESGLLADLVLKLKLEIYSPGDYICKKGDIGKEMYIIKRGKLEVVADDGVTVFATLGEGSIFGEISILNIQGIRSGNRRTANVRSIGYSDLFQLSKGALWDALKEYPEAKKKMLNRGKHMLMKDHLLDEVAAAVAEQRQSSFVDKVERVEKSIDELQNRFAHLLAEEASSLTKLRQRVARLNELMRLQMSHYH